MFSNDIGNETLIHALKNPMAIILTGARCLLEREKQYGKLNESQKKVVLRIIIDSMGGRYCLEREGQKKERLTVTLPHRLETRVSDCP